MTAPQDLFQAAQSVLRHSYSPYSRFPVACALRAENGLIYVGCNVENLSFPAGFCAESNAIGQLISAGQTKISEILVMIPGESAIAPCGLCRQQLSEFADANTPVHLCSSQGFYQKTNLNELLPNSFKIYQETTHD